MAAAPHPRPEDPPEDSAKRFAFELRALRNSAGNPTYRQMAARTGQSPGALSEAAQGGHLPPLEVALAYAEACGGDRTEWERRWRAAEAGLTTAPTPKRRWPVIAVAGTAALALAVAGAVLAKRLVHESPPADSTGRSARFFADDDVFNQRHPHPRPAPDSARMVADLLALGRVELNTGEASPVVYRAASSTPTYTITPRKHLGQWGANPFEGIGFPWDAAWKAPAERQWTVVIAPDGRSLECWRAQVRNGKPSCEWGAVSDTHGSSVSAKGQPTGSGLSRLAGIITRADWKAGHIDHALGFGTPDNNSQYVYPAVRSDGGGQGRWREGQFIWLDPAYDVDADTSLTPYERMIAKALQEYGAFNVKNSQKFGFVSEYGSKPPGSKEEYASLEHIKFARYLRVGTITPAS
ncbi:helix-turn-helix transcriptional regulator [Streptomyces sp. WELS2]|uniref:helix-turn-helix domain-containing protein n=1 Tax=Streptomyces sp. WELS2 TaxID=2749435 RepID=UPI0015EFF249|nr:helix-turn-helix transcriptional regulator [Streptomyces sp. WELS2]